MTYEECIALVEAYTETCVLAEKLGEPLVQDAMKIRDYLGDFIVSLLNESPIGENPYEKATRDE